MDRYIIVLVACLTINIVVLPQLVSTQDDTTEPTKCCLPDQFTISVSNTVGLVRESLKGQLTVLEVKYQAYDFTNDRIAAHIFRRFINGQPEEYVQVIEDIKKGTSWVIQPYTQTCNLAIAAEFPFHLDRCIADYAGYVGVSHIGNKAIIADAWSFFVPDEEQYPINGLFSTTVGRDGCIPLAETYAGNSNAWSEKQQITSQGVYWNYTQGIANPEQYFTVPDYCKQESLGKGRKNGEPTEDIEHERKRKEN